MSLPTGPVKKCKAERCDEIAVVHCAWPGDPADFCLACAIQANSVAVAMGFVVEFTPLTLDEVQA